MLDDEDTEVLLRLAIYATLLVGAAAVVGLAIGVLVRIVTEVT